MIENPTHTTISRRATIASIVIGLLLGLVFGFAVDTTISTFLAPFIGAITGWYLLQLSGGRTKKLLTGALIGAVILLVIIAIVLYIDHPFYYSNDYRIMAAWSIVGAVLGASVGAYRDSSQPEPEA